VALRLGVGSVLTLGLRFRLGLGFQPLHGSLDPHQALLPAGQLGRQFVPSTAAQGGIVCLVLLICLRHQGFNILA